MIDASTLCLGDEFAGGIYLGGDFVVAPGYIPRMTLSDGYIYCQFIRINGYIDWRMPTWKELDYIRRFPFTQQYLRTNSKCNRINNIYFLYDQIPNKSLKLNAGTYGTIDMSEQRSGYSTAWVIDNTSSFMLAIRSI